MHSKSFPPSHQRLALFIIVFSHMLAAFFVDSQPRFTKEPRSKYYVLSGDDATFQWKYFVHDRGSKFEILSPKWSFYEENGTERIIGNDFKFNNWNWQIVNSSCPERLLKPTLRVFRKENATLLITNVTTADNGMYGCTLVLKSPPSIESKVQLIVTVTPQITFSKIKSVLENDNVTATCSAIGPPAPNVTWIRRKDDKVLSFGVNGSAVLTIYNITRDQSDGYLCRATNNPDEHVNRTLIIPVQYPVEFDEELSTKSVKAYLGDKDVVLKSAAGGVPTPTHVWFLPNKMMVKSENSTKSTYEIKVVEEKHIGNWTVNITNGILSYFYVHRIEVVKASKRTCQGCTTAQKVGFALGLLIAVLIMVVIAIVIYRKKKEKKKWKDWTTLEKVLIVLGFLVAIVIIIVVIVFIIMCICK